MRVVSCCTSTGSDRSLLSTRSVKSSTMIRSRMPAVMLSLENATEDGCSPLWPTVVLVSPDTSLKPFGSTKQYGAPVGCSTLPPAQDSAERPCVPPDSLGDGV